MEASTPAAASLSKRTTRRRPRRPSFGYCYAMAMQKRAAHDDRPLQLVEAVA